MLPDGSLAEAGEADVTTDANGNVYLPAGNILVYDTQGNYKNEIKVPERPSSIVFGGKDRNKLFICARSRLYSLKNSTK